MSAAAKPILGYWNVRGLGAQLRYMLKFCEVDINEELYNQHFDEEATGYDRWNGDEWWKVNETKGLDMPNLPYFIDGDVKLVQSSAIARYICAKWKPELLGTSPAQQGYVAMLEMTLADFNGELDRISFGVEGTVAQLKETTKENLGPVHKFLGEKKFLAGDNLTFVDFILFEQLDKCNDAHIFDGQLWETFPGFKPYFERIQALPNVMTAEERKAQGYYNGWRAKLGGAGLEMFKKYKQLDNVTA